MNAAEAESVVIGASTGHMSINHASMRQFDKCV